MPPIVTGIDVADVIANVDESGDRFEGGEHVVLYWNTTYCGVCEHCQDGETTLCRDYGGLGVKRDGGHSEYVAVDPAFAVELPEGVGFE